MRTSSKSCGRTHISRSISEKTNEGLEQYAEEKNLSVCRVVKEDFIDKHDAKRVLKKACESGELKESSQVCKHVERHIEPALILFHYDDIVFPRNQPSVISFVVTL